MPKKFLGENSKSAVARARKAEKAATEKAQKEKEVEDAYWHDDDKHANKKLQRKEEKEKKKREEIAKKLEIKMLEESENVDNTLNKPASKVTQYQIQNQKDMSDTKTEEQKTHLDEPLVENLNRLAEETIEASGIDAAVTALSLNDSSATPDRHPEKRMAAAFKAFETDRLPQLKKENPNMRLSQLKQMLRKEWMKHPSNPLNQRLAA